MVVNDVIKIPTLMPSVNLHAKEERQNVCFCVYMCAHIYSYMYTQVLPVSSPYVDALKGKNSKHQSLE